MLEPTPEVDDFEQDVLRFDMAIGGFTWDHCQAMQVIISSELEAKAATSDKLADALMAIQGIYWIVGFHNNMPMYRQQPSAEADQLFLWFFDNPKAEHGWYFSKWLWASVKQSHAIQAEHGSPLAWVSSNAKTNLISEGSRVHMPFNQSGALPGLSLSPYHHELEVALQEQQQKAIELEQHVAFLEQHIAELGAYAGPAQSSEGDDANDDDDDDDDVGKGKDKGKKGKGKGKQGKKGGRSRGGWAQHFIDGFAMYATQQHHMLDAFLAKLAEKTPWVNAAINRTVVRMNADPTYAQGVVDRAA